MDELSIYFTPLSRQAKEGQDRLSDRIDAHTVDDGFPELGNDIDIVLIGVEEFRRMEEGDPDKDNLDPIRHHFYQLADHFPQVGIADLGNIVAGNEASDTDHALSNSIATAIHHEFLPVVIGGGQELSYAHFKGYQDLERTIELGVADAFIDLGDPEGPLDDRSFLGHILAHRPNFLFDLVHLGSQRHFNPPELMEVLERMQFDLYRLGEIQKDIQEAEPFMRSIDLLSFDLSVLKESECPATSNSGPNGLYGEEACQLMRYAGMNDKLTSLGIYGYLSHLDHRERSAAMVAQMLWYFIDGYAARPQDRPILNKKAFKRFTVDLQSSGHRLVFYKSKKSDRWWLEVPYPPDPALEHERSLLTPCSYSDYLMALDDEIPDKWWRTYRKLG